MKFALPASSLATWTILPSQPSMRSDGPFGRWTYCSRIRSRDIDCRFLHSHARCEPPISKNPEGSGGNGRAFGMTSMMSIRLPLSLYPARWCHHSRDRRGSPCLSVLYSPGNAYYSGWLDRRRSCQGDVSHCKPSRFDERAGAA
jgi:hypothetical protein